jgi:hypothetical protein
VQIGILTTYAHTGGAFTNYLGSLRSKGWIRGGNGDVLQITDAGIAALGRWTPLPSGRALLDHWLGRLTKAERGILSELAKFYPRALTKGQIAAATGYAAGSGNFGNALSRLRTLDLIDGRAEMRASAALFDAPAGAR